MDGRVHAGRRSAGGVAGTAVAADIPGQSILQRGDPAGVGQRHRGQFASSERAVARGRVDRRFPPFRPGTKPAKPATLAGADGLLGTFWGLLATIRSVSDIIGSMGGGNDALAMFGQLKEHLKQPLAGMATSFATSLFGLSSSLIIGFLDLQAGHAQNRFYNELEEWLSGMTRLSSGGPGGDGDGGSVPAYVEALLEQTADGLERMQRNMAEGEHDRHLAAQRLGELSTQMGRIAELLGRDARDRQNAAEGQDELRSVLRQLANQPSGEGRLTDELRSELRLLSRTIAAAVEGTRSTREPRP